MTTLIHSLATSFLLFASVCFAAPPIQYVDARSMEASISIKSAADIEMNIKYTAKVLLQGLLANSNFSDLKIDTMQEVLSNGDNRTGQKNYVLTLHDEMDNKFTCHHFTTYTVNPHEDPRTGKLTHTIQTTFDRFFRSTTYLVNFKNDPILKIK